MIVNNVLPVLTSILVKICQTTEIKEEKTRIQTLLFSRLLIVLFIYLRPGIAKCNRSVEHGLARR